MASSAEPVSQVGVPCPVPPLVSAQPADATPGRSQVLSALMEIANLQRQASAISAPPPLLQQCDSDDEGSAGPDLMEDEDILCKTQPQLELVQREPNRSAPYLEARSPSPHTTATVSDGQPQDQDDSVGSKKSTRRRRQRKHPSLFIGGLPSSTSAAQEELRAELQRLLQTCGKVVHLAVKNGFAFADFQQAGASERAAAILHGQSFRGKKLVARVQTQDNVVQAKEAKARGAYIDTADSPSSRGSMLPAGGARSPCASVTSSVGHSAESSPARSFSRTPEPAAIYPQVPMPQLGLSPFHQQCLAAAAAGEVQAQAQAMSLQYAQLLAAQQVLGCPYGVPPMDRV